MRGALFLASVALAAQAAVAQEDAQRGFAPARQVLERRCVQCHNESESKGGLDLSTASAALAGGDGGASIVPAQPDDSWLLEMVAGPQPEMPKLGDPLSPDEVATLRSWIAAGAPWPEGQVLRDRRFEGQRWWSLEPLVQPAVPSVESDWPRTPIDAFILQALAERGLQPAPEADRRTLIRRLSFDLTGLPPTPEEIAAFQADPRPDAYERLVDRLLASPRYGERWARHWLDVVHYGETHGYDKDKPRDHAWPYRDYVIRSFNADKPYHRFVAEQIAGDVLFPDTLDGIEALGFIAAGPWDLIGHMEVPESKIDGQIARHMDRDDMVSNTIGTFCSVTVHCAQCHDHKFDPITQEDYYSLQAVFAALDRADRSYDADPELARRRSELAARRVQLQQRQAALEKQLQQRGGRELAELDARIETEKNRRSGGRRPEYGYHSEIAKRADVEKWVQVDLGSMAVISRVEVTGCFDTYNDIGAGFGFPPRFKIEAAADPRFTRGVTLLADCTTADVPNPGTRPLDWEFDGVPARYVRFTATRLAPRRNDFILALDELEIFDPAGANLASGAEVDALDSIEAPPRWARRNLVDGITYDRQTDPATRIEQLAASRLELLRRAGAGDLLDQQRRTEQQLRQLAEQIDALPAPRLVYCGTVHHGKGNFVGTGARGGLPREIRVLHRGDVRSPQQAVGPGALSALAPLAGRFELSADHTEGDRRAALAAWLTDRRHPLVWRSIVNRVWLYHFGRGLCDTPNDFGRMGQRPSHPELLDWLAAEFRDGGQSLKSLHRLIATSAVYRQAAQSNPAAEAIDSDNVYLWRMNRRRLEAEALRDSVLFVAGKLDETMYGASFQDFVIEKPEHSPHYQYHLHDAEDPRSHRRSIYRFIVRSQQQPFMTVLDCADPSMLVEKRNETVSPLQALAMLNNQLMLVMARHFAQRLEATATDTSAQVTEAFRLALGREPATAEAEALTAYANQHGLANACRVILNLNEFTFVD